MRNRLGYSGLLLLLGLPFARATDLSVGELTTVSSTVHNGYQREKLPDGSFKPINYVFGEGACDPGRVIDRSFDHLKFRQLAKLVSEPLAKQGYQPGRDPHNIDQLIVISWGRTVGWDSAGFGNAYGTLNQAYSYMKQAGPGGGGGAVSGPRTRSPGGMPGAAGEMDHMLFMLSLQDTARNEMDVRNARLLGYEPTVAHLPTYWGNMTSYRREQLMQELEDDRYYVVLIAYDFPETLKSRRPKPLWITRFSLQARGNDFDRCINRMIRAASPYFGRSTDGLFREKMREGQIEAGELRVLDWDKPTKK